MRFAFDAARMEMSRDGTTSFPFISRESAIQLAAHVYGHADLTLSEGDPPPGLFDRESHHYRYRVLKPAAFAKMSAVVATYNQLPHLLSAITGRDVSPSPHADSTITGLVYDHGDESGWHYDTNGLTALLYLADCQAGGTEMELPSNANPFQPPQARRKIVLPVAGNLLLLEGRRIRHRGLSPAPNEAKVVVAFNYYYDGDFWRPEDASRYVY